jgi:alpha-tubulin suppressor-like RCC1 family protein
MAGRSLLTPLLAAVGAGGGGCFLEPSDPSAAPVPIPTQRIALERGWGCVLETGGEVVCFDKQGGVTRPTPADGSVRFVTITGSGTHACGITADSTLWCWGGNRYGQLGDGSATDRREATRVDTDLKFVNVSTGGGSTCALDPRGRAYCWGRRNYGQMGDGFPIDTGHETYTPTPFPVAGRYRFVALHGRLGNCGLTRGGEVYCWGSASGTLVDYVAPGECRHTYYVLWGRGQCVTPTRVRTSLHFIRMTSPGCGLTVRGLAYCWGFGAWGQLGNGTFAGGSIEPVPVAGGMRFKQVASGGSHNCALDLEGRAYCWGFNFHGELGVGDHGPRPVGYNARNRPTAVLSDQRFAEIQAGPSRTCALSVTSELWCWGANQHEWPQEATDVPTRIAAVP